MLLSHGIKIFNKVRIRVVVIDFTMIVTIPLEMFVGGRENDLSPAVVYGDSETFAVYLIDIWLWQAEIIVEAIAIGREGIGHGECFLAGRDDKV